MKLNREHFCLMIYYDFWYNLTPPVRCLERLILTFDDKEPSNTTVYRWLHLFKNGRKNLKDVIREGSTVIIQKKSRNC